MILILVPGQRPRNRIFLVEYNSNDTILVSIPVQLFDL